MISSKSSLGSLGESIAADYLVNKGYLIEKRNFRCRLGEIDIIAKKNNSYIFIEVKTRISNRLGAPYEAVNINKIKRIKDTAMFYMLKKGLKGYKLSVHVLSLFLNPDKSVREIKHFENVML